MAHVCFGLVCRISEITLEVAEVGTPSQDSEIAHQIEKCDCPLGYAGLSCEVMAFVCNI